VRMVWQVRNATRLPIIGMGGIETHEDALELIMAGANAVAVGSAALVDPMASIKVRDGLARWCAENGVPRVMDLSGCVKIW